MMRLNVMIKNHDRILFGAVILLCIIGMVMIYSASSSLSMVETNGRTDTLFLQAHLKRVFIGVIALFGFLFLDFRRLKIIAPYLMVGSIGLLLLTKGLYLINGNHSPARWIYLGSISVQTSDIARLSLIIFLAAYLDRKRDHIKDFYNGLLPPVILIGTVVVLIILQPDFSTAVMLGIISLLMLFVGGAKISQLLATGATSLVFAVPVMLMMPYRRERILSWFQGGTDGSDAGYQITQSMISLGNGGWLGMGLGNSMEKNLFLPTPHTDFIFAIIGEEIGLIGVMAILTLFLFIFQRGIKIAKESTEPFGVFLTIGISFSFIIYAFVNVAVVTHLLPVTGVQMPMISYGGSGMVVNLAAIGILLNISQSKRSLSQRKGWKTKLYG